MRPGWIATFLLLLAAAGCSPAVRAPAKVEESVPLPQEDPEYVAAVALLAAGPVDRYVPLGWLDNARKALVSVVDATDPRGSPAPALLWADLAARGVIERPDSDLVFEILSEHVRIANHALSPDHAAASLERLKRFASLDPVRAAWVAVLSVQSKIANTRMPDGSFSSRFWSSAVPAVRQELAAVDELLGPLTAPAQSDRGLFDIWLKLRIAWASILCDVLTGSAAALSRTQPAGWEDTQQGFEKRLHQAIWYVPSDRYPSVTSLLYLKLARFHRLYGEVDKAADDLNVARRLVTGARDLDGIARVDLAEADSILAPGSSVELLGVHTSGPEVDSLAPEPPPDIRPPEPETIWRARADKVAPMLVRAEATFRTFNNPMGLSATRIRRGFLEARLGNHDDAAEFYRQAEAASRAAFDPAGRAVAWFHLVALHLSTGEIGLAQNAARELFALLKNNGLAAHAVGMGEALLGMAGRELRRFGTPNQRLAVLHMSARCFEVADQPLLTLRHQAALLKLAAHFGYLEIVRHYAARALSSGPPTDGAAPAAAAGARGVRCIVSHVLAAALLANPQYAAEAVEPARQAVQCVSGVEAPPAGLDADEARLTAALALASTSQVDKAYALVPPDDDDLVLQVATRAGQTRRLVELARKAVASARKSLEEEVAALPPPPEHHGSSEPPPPVEDSEAIKTAKALLAEELVRLAGALLDDVAASGKASSGTSSSPEAEEAGALLGEWKSLGVERSALDKRPWEALSLHGRLAAGLLQPDAAWMFFSGAFQLLMAARDRTPGASRQAAFTRSVGGTLRRIGSFLLAFPDRKFELPDRGTMDGAAAALLIVEDMKAQALGGLLVTGMDYQARMLDSQDGMAFAALGQRMRNAHCEEEYWAQAENAPPGRAEAARADHNNVEVWLDQAVRDLGRKYPRLAFARAEHPLFSPEKAVAFAAERKITFVVYTTALPEPYAWVVTGQGIRTVHIEAGSAEIGLLVRDLLTALSGNDASPAAAPATRLYELLLLPVASMLPQGGTVAIVPDGPLHSLPFAVLTHGESTFIEQHPFFVVSSVDLALQIAAAGESAPSSLAAAPGLATLLVADPLLVPSHGAMPLVRLLDIHAPASAARTQPGPPGSEGVAPPEPPLTSGLRTLLGEDLLSTAIGPQANEVIYAKLAPEQIIVHLSAPVLRFGAEPMFSGLMLGRSDLGEDDGLLQCWEIATRQLRARLAVVEVTQTSPGLLAEEEALAGIPRGFFTAGVPVVVTNLLPVPPDASTAFFLRFYEALRNGAPVAAAVRTAALALKAVPRFAHPRDWGAFVAVGLGDKPL